MPFSRALMCDLSFISIVHLHIFLSSTMMVSLYGHMYLKCAMYEVYYPAWKSVTIYRPNISSDSHKQLLCPIWKPFIPSGQWPRHTDSVWSLGHTNNIMRLQVCRSAAGALQCLDTALQTNCSIPAHIMLLGSTSQPRRGNLATLISADKVTKAVARPWWEHNLMIAPCHGPLSNTLSNTEQQKWKMFSWAQTGSVRCTHRKIISLKATNGYSYNNVECGCAPGTIWHIKLHCGTLQSCTKTQCFSINLFFASPPLSCLKPPITHLPPTKRRPW